MFLTVLNYHQLIFIIENKDLLETGAYFII